MCTGSPEIHDFGLFIYFSSVKVSSEMFESLVHFKCLRTLADPGEAMGLLAAQVS
jgi:hypothetical protein